MSFQHQEMPFEQPQESAAPPLCAAGCGFFGSAATLDMCSVCYKKHRPVTDEPASATSAAAVSKAVETSAAAAATVTTTGAAATTAGVSFAPATEGKGVAEAAAVSSSSMAKVAEKGFANRCQACLKKVGLTGFVCRCGKTFCGSHRYAEEHGCTFDFKGASRVSIARNNPLIKGEKLSYKI